MFVTTKIILTHGVMMAVCFTTLFPMGGILLRVLNIKHIAWFHGIWQTVTYLLALSAFGIGVWMATELDQVSCNSPGSAYRKSRGESPGDVDFAS
jgi:hypothetical protein